MQTSDRFSTNKNTVLLVSTLASFIIPFMGSSITVALPVLGQEFSLNAVMLGWVLTIYLLMNAMFMVPFGRVADIYGRKKIFLWGMCIHSIFSFVCAVAPTSVLFIGSRALQGFGAAMVFGTSTALLTSAYPPEIRGRALGINVAAVYAGLSLGPVLGGLITQSIGWRFIFYLNVLLGFVVIVITLWRLKGDWIEAKGERFDYTGSLIYCMSLLAIMFGFSELPDLIGIWVVLVGILALSLFIWWETRVGYPILEISLFRNNTVFSLSNIAALINYSATFGVSFLLSLYLQYIKGLTPATAGSILIAQPITMTILSPVAGRVSERIEPRVVASMGMALCATGLILLSFIDNTSAIVFVLVSLIVLGFGFAFFSSPNTNAVMGSVNKKFYGVASGMLGTMRSLGQMLSVGIAMLLFAIYIGKVQISPLYYPQLLSSVKTAFIVFAFLCFLGIFASLARGRAYRN